MLKRNNKFAVYSCIILFFTSLIINGCVKAEYQKPSINIPESYRGESYVQPLIEDAPKDSKELGEIYWWDFIQDDVLKGLINIALVSNYDSRLAVEKILQAEANVGYVRSNQLPKLDAYAQYQAGKDSKYAPQFITLGAIQDNAYHEYGLSLQATYELDLWGKLRRATDAARSELLAANEARYTVLMTLVSDVATNYFTLRELDEELSITKDTVKTREESYKLVKARCDGGVGNMLEVDQALGLLQYAKAQQVIIEKNIEQQENTLCFLLGKNPGDITRGKSLTEQLKELSVPEGLPSKLLANRPDIRQAEDNLIAANANIDVARAAYFPDISITGSGGYLSTQMNNLFAGAASSWMFAPTIAQSIFNAGKIDSSVEIAKSQQRQLVITYEKTVQNAFREVSNYLVGYAKIRDYRKEQENFTATCKDQARLSNLRYIGGVTSYL